MAIHSLKEELLCFIDSILERSSEAKYRQFLRLMADHYLGKFDTTTLTVRIRWLFREHQDIVQEFNSLLPKEYVEEKKKEETATLEETLIFVRSLKASISEDEYSLIFNSVCMHSCKKISLHDLFSNATKILKNYSDLAERFASFLPVSSSSSFGPDPSISKMRLRDGDNRPKDNMGFGKKDSHNRDRVSKIELMLREFKEEERPSYLKRRHCNLAKRVRSLLPGPPSSSQLKANTSKKRLSDSNSLSDHNDKKRRLAEENNGRSANELLLRRHDRQDNPSYHLRIKVEREASASKRTKLDALVLNDVFESSAYEGCKPKRRQWSSSEENSFKIEDGMFDMDRFLSLARVSAKKVDELLKNLTEDQVPQSPVHVDQHLSSQDLTCFKLLYGKKDWETIKSKLNEDPRLVLTVINPRLKQKKDEVSNDRKRLIIEAVAEKKLLII